MHKDRLDKGKSAYATISYFANNHNYNKKARYRMADALIKPILTYGYTALEESKKNENRIQIEMNKIYRQIEQAEIINKGKEKEIEYKKKNPDKRKHKAMYNFERKTNNQIRMMNNLRTIESQFIKERAQFSINAKITNSMAYNYNKDTHDHNIKKARDIISGIKKILIDNSRTVNTMNTIEDHKEKVKNNNTTNRNRKQINKIEIACNNTQCKNFKGQKKQYKLNRNSDIQTRKYR